MKYFLMLFLVSSVANAQLTLQGSSTINEQLNLATARTWSKSLTFKNIGSTDQTLSASLSGQDAAKFKISTNRCNVAIKRGQSCLVTIESLRGIQSRLSPYLVSFSNASISLNVTNSQNPPISDSAPVSASFSFSPTSLPLVEFYPGELSKTITLTVVNDGNVAKIPDVVINTDGNLSLSFAVNRCNVSVEPRKSCSIQVKISNPTDLETKYRDLDLKVDGTKIKFITVSAVKSKLCQPNSQRACVLSNATAAIQSCSSDGGSYGSCLATSCSNGFVLENSQCIPAQYTAAYSQYTPAVPSNLSACSVTVTSNRTISECRRDYDNVLVSNNLCSDPTPQVITQSPAGSKNVSILNGTETYQCEEGSTTQVFSSRSCDLGFHNDMIQCAINQYVATYSAYNPEIPTNLQACDVSVTSTRMVSECRQQHDHQQVFNNLCSDPNPSILTQSPAGTKLVSISNGEETRQCDEGSTVQNFVSRSCDSDYYDHNNACESITYVASYNAYDPEIPTNLQSCDGTTVSSRTINECRQQHDNVLVANTKCPVDSTPTISTPSPEGQRSYSISHGSEVRSCLEGSSIQTFISRSCESGYADYLNACREFEYAATEFSQYSPPIPTLNACDANVTSTRTISTCVRQDKDICLSEGSGSQNCINSHLAVSTSLCTDLNASVNTLSPAGSKDILISNGSETYTCPAGSTVQTFASRSCNSGYFNNGSSCQEIVLNYWGSGADGNLNTAGNTNLCDNTINGEMCVRNYQNLTINSGHVLTTSVRRRGLLIYVQGDLVVNGEISMTARGASGTPVLFGVGTNGLSFYRFKSGGNQSGTSSIAGTGSTAVTAESNQAAVTNGVLINIPRYGAVPQARITTNLTSTQGVNGVNGQTGSGGGGYLYFNGGTGNSAGPGGQGSCFTGGSGGGANFANTPNNLQCASGVIYGGAGGNGCGDHPFGTGGGGAGNPVGTHVNRSTYTHAAPVEGTGGLIVIMVKGSVTIGSAGKITSLGSRGGYWINPANGGTGYYGGGSGGGTIALVYAGTYNNGGSILTTGGNSSTDGIFKAGDGSKIIIQVDK